MRTTLRLALSAVALSATASAQIITGFPSGNTYAHDLATNTPTEITQFSGLTVLGLAADDANQRVYALVNSGSTELYTWTYNDPAAPTNLGFVTDSAGTTGRIDGLAFGNGTLYALVQFTVGTADVGIYEVNLTTLQLDLVMLTTGGSYSGLGYDAVNNRFYVPNDTAMEIWVIDPVAMTEAPVPGSAYPNGQSDFDGLDYGNGTVYIAEDAAGDPAYAFDLASGTYGAPITNDNPTTSFVCAVAYAPGLVGGGPAIGTSFCTPNPNSTGATGVLTATGSIVAADNNLTLQVSDLPGNQFGIVVVSDVIGPAVVPPGSQGALCLTGQIGRYSLPGEIFQVNGVGSTTYAIDLTAIRRPTMNVPTNPGDTWYFQAWHRDVFSGGPTSNFTSGVEITFN